MQGAFGSGDMWGVPVRGSFVSLDGADVADVLRATSGLAVTLVGASAVGLGISLVGTFLALRSASGRVPITSMADVVSPKRSFKGVCLNKEFSIRCDGQTLTIPSEYVNIIGLPVFHFSRRVETVDGSTYKDFQFANPELRFLTLAGIQTVNIHDEKITIYGNTVADIRQLKSNLSFALDNNAEEVVRTIGKNVFERFFYR
jgi:hypothetical protein